MALNLDLKLNVLPTKKRFNKVNRSSESQKRFGHRQSTTSKNKNKDTPIKHGYHLEDYGRRVVYEHYYNNEKLPFYVGQGKIERAFDFRRNKRTDNYNEKAINVDLIKVNIVAIDISKEDAENLEEELIAKYKRYEDGGSLINICKQKSGGFNINRCVTIYQFDKDGNYITSFSSIIQASKQTGISANNIWQCANGYSSYSHAGGYKWRYTKEFTNIENTVKSHHNYSNRDYKAEYKNYKEKYYEKYKEKYKKQRKEARKYYLNGLNLTLKFD